MSVQSIAIYSLYCPFWNEIVSNCWRLFRGRECLQWLRKFEEYSDRISKFPRPYNRKLSQVLTSEFPSVSNSQKDWSYREEMEFRFNCNSYNCKSCLIKVWHLTYNTSFRYQTYELSWIDSERAVSQWLKELKKKDTVITMYVQKEEIGRDGEKSNDN